MNTMDLAIIASFTLGGLLGTWVGFIRAAFVVGGVVVGLVMFGQFRAYFATVVGNYVPNDTLTAALGYAVTVFVLVAAAVVGAAIVRTVLYRLFLGWVDRLAGLALGLMVSTLITVTAVGGLAGLSHGTEVSQDGLAGTVLENIPHATELKDELGDALWESSLVEALVWVSDALRENAVKGGSP